MRQSPPARSHRWFHNMPDPTPDFASRPAADRLTEAEWRINEAWRTEASILDLSKIGLTTLPESLGGL